MAITDLLAGKYDADEIISNNDKSMAPLMLRTSHLHGIRCVFVALSSTRTSQCLNCKVRRRLF